MHLLTSIRGCGMDNIFDAEQRELLRTIAQGHIQFGKYKGRDIQLEAFFVRVLIEFKRVSGEEGILAKYSTARYAQALGEFREILEQEIGEEVKIKTDVLPPGGKHKMSVPKKVLAQAKSHEARLLRGIPAGDR